MHTEFCGTEYSIGMLLERLRVHSCFPTQHGHDLVAHCPCHPVAQSYLIVWTTKSGEPWLECKDGCSADEILAALGMAPCDLLTAATCSRSTSSHDSTGIGNGDRANWWKDRGKLSNDEPVIVTGRDSQGCLRTQIVPWGNIEDDFAATPLGLMQIVNVERVSDLPIPDEELAPSCPPAIRDSPDLELPGESFASQPSRWERKLRKCQNYYWRERGAAKFAEVLGVSTSAVLSLGAVADEDNRRWLLPERDSAHYITGLAVRYMNPWIDENGVLITKGFVSGGRRGLYFADALLRR